jgi:hypothetical protein
MENDIRNPKLKANCHFECFQCSDSGSENVSRSSRVPKRSRYDCIRSHLAKWTSSLHFPNFGNVKKYFFSSSIQQGDFQ